MVSGGIRWQTWLFKRLKIERYSAKRVFVPELQALVLWLISNDSHPQGGGGSPSLPPGGGAGPKGAGKDQESEIWPCFPVFSSAATTQIVAQSRIYNRKHFLLISSVMEKKI